jgi:hypothetical protein
MKENHNSDEEYMFKDLCSQVRKLIKNREFESCYKMVTEEMKNSPHAPEPHNLLGMLLEKEDNHSLAMKHFRAAWALDPTYLPARYNLEVYGMSFYGGLGAYDREDCPILEESTYGTKYNENKIGQIVRRNRNEFK